MSNGQTKKKKLIRKRSIVDKAARKAESTEVGRTRRAMHKSGKYPREEYMSRGRVKIASRIEKERQDTWEKLTKDPMIKAAKKKIAKFSETDPLVREVNRRMAKKKKAKLRKSVVRKRH